MLLTVAQQVVDERDLDGVFYPENLKVVWVAEVVEGAAIVRCLLVGEPLAGLVVAPRKVVQAAVVRGVYLRTTNRR